MSIKLTVSKAQAQAIARLVPNSSIIFIPKLKVNLQETKEGEFIELPDNADMKKINDLVKRGLCSLVEEVDKVKEVEEVEEETKLSYEASRISVQKTKQLDNGADLIIEATIKDIVLDKTVKVNVDIDTEFDNTVEGTSDVAYAISLPEGWTEVDGIPLNGTIKVTVKAA